MTKVRRPAQWAGRLLLVGVVAFWWGGYVVPHLVSIAFADFLPFSALPEALDADREGFAANAVSAAVLATVALLAFVNAGRSLRPRDKWISLAGWTALGLTTVVLAVEEIAEFKAETLIPAAREVYHSSLWPLLLSPLLVAFAGGMWLFARKGLEVPEARTPLTLGIAAWIFALAHESSETVLFASLEDLERVLEETLEFSGTLLVGLSAGLALRGRGALRIRWHRWFVHAVVAVVVIGGLSVAFVFRVPLVDARAHGPVGYFQVELPSEWSVAQGLRMPGAPIRQFRVPMALGSPPDGRARAVPWRVIREETATIVREGFVEVSAVSHLPWTTIDLVHPLTEPEGTQLALMLIADPQPNDEDAGFWSRLRVGAIKGDRYPDGRLWINDEPAWSDQDLVFVAHGAPEPTWSKFQSLWELVTTNWRWAVLAVSVSGALTLITFVPMVLVAAALPAWPKRRSGVSA